MALNETITADQACDLGLVTRVVEDERFEEEIATLITTLKSSIPGVLSELKALMRASANRSFSEQLDAEAFAIARRAARAETLERLRAFLKRERC